MFVRLMKFGPSACGKHELSSFKFRHRSPGCTHTLITYLNLHTVLALSIKVFVNLCYNFVLTHPGSRIETTH